eukprot:PhM_4_TR1289/c1_g1_i10/m.7445
MSENRTHPLTTHPHRTQYSNINTKNDNNNKSKNNIFNCREETDRKAIRLLLCARMNKDSNDKNINQYYILKTIQLLLLRAGVHPNPGPSSLHQLARTTIWTSSRPAPTLERLEMLNEMDRMGLTWRSTPLHWSQEKEKKSGIFQSTNRNSSSPGFYVRCADAHISVIDLDCDTPAVRAILSKLAGRCNLVALTPNGVHLLFAHHPALPRGFTGPEFGFDIRTFDSRASDIVLIPPSAYNHPSYGKQQYEWLVFPQGDLASFPEDVLAELPGRSRISRAPRMSRPPRQQKPQNQQPPKLPRTATPLRVASWNMHQGAKAALAELLQWAPSQDVIALQELGSGIDALRHITDFYHYYTEATGGRSTALLVRKSIVESGREIHLPPLDGITATAAQVNLGNQTLVVVNVYVSPTTCKGTLAKFLADTALLHPDIVLGDMNARNEKWCPASREDLADGRSRHDPAHNRGAEVLRFTEDTEWNLLQPCLITPTHFSAKRPTTPDVILLRQDHLASQVQYKRTPSSDHAQISLNLEHVTPSSRPQGGPKVSWNKITPYDRERYKARLDDLLHNYDPHTSLDQRVWAFVAAARTAEKCLPRGKLKNCVPGWSSRASALKQTAIQLRRENAPNATEAEGAYQCAATGCPQSNRTSGQTI